MKKVLVKCLLLVGGIIPSIALMVASTSVDGACFFCAHQPDIPAGMEKYRKSR